MNQKEFSSNGTLKNSATQMSNKLPPSFNRPYQKFKAYAERSPKKTVMVMVAFATLNFIIMVYIVNTAKPTTLIPKNIGNTISETTQAKSGGISFSISNFMKMSKLKDSMDYLMKQPRLTKPDSLLFIRICDEYAKLDPTFFKQVKEAINKKQHNPNYEKDNH